MTSLAFTTANGKLLTMGEGRLRMISTNGLDSPPLFIVTTAGPIESRTIALNPVNLARKIKADVLVDLQGMDENEAQALILEICAALEESDSEGLMTVSREGRIRQIEARSSRNPEFSRKVWNKPWLCMEAEFICPQPYFVDMSLQTMSAEFYEELTDIAEQGIEFTTEGREFSMIMIIGSKLTLLQNDGNAEAPVKIKFAGPTVNPHIKNKTSGEMIRITRTLWENEYIEIDTTPGKREIKLFKNETLENGMHYLDLESKFWRMLPGENMIEIGEGSPGAGAKYFIEFYTHYKEA